ncbi:MAG: OmpA family protein [Sneathiella sp.]|nr:OmpA family protein [Sneathiella sp.]
MQCQGKTQLGRQCRNRALEGELFCDIHMRVQHSANLAYVAPLLLAGAGLYFFLFALILKTVTFSSFDLNYMEYAGLEDLILQTIRVGAFISLSLILLWLMYAVLLAFVFVGILSYRLFQNTKSGKLPPKNRLRIIGLGIAVFLTNFLIRIVSLIPALQSRHGDRISTHRDNLASAIYDIKSLSDEERAARPIRTAREIFADYIYFRSFGHHRFLLSTLLLCLLSAVLLISASRHAAEYKHCAEDPYFQMSDQEFTPKTGFLLNQGCEQARHAVAGYVMDIHPIATNLSGINARLLHLATTSRFHILYDGSLKESILVPKGSLFTAAAEDIKNLQGNVQTIEGSVAALSHKVDKSLSLVTEIKSLLRDSVALNQQQTNRLSEIANNTPAATPAPPHISETCLKQAPVQIVAFDLGSSKVEGIYLLKQLELLSRHLKKKPNLKIVLAGFADISGNTVFNNKLSRLRAQRVAEKLEQYGVEISRLVQVGMGENQTTDYPARRVEIRVCQL